MFETTTFGTAPKWMLQILTAAEVEELRALCTICDKPGARVTVDGMLANAIHASSLVRKLRHQFPNLSIERIVAFNKSGGSNWGVPWHQDRVIEVDQRHEKPGYSNWSKKDGQWHCEPSVEVLQSMLFTRIFLDEVDASNGGMQFAVGSHKEGKIASARAKAVAEEYLIENEVAAAGDVLVLPMLTLHRSQPSNKNVDRRVLRVDFATRPIT